MHVDAVRRFNRFYTRRIDALDESFLGSGFTLAEARVLYEIRHGGLPTAADLAARLGLDQAYLSRMLASFGRRGLVARRRSAKDGRKNHLRLTPRGRRALAPLDRAAREHVASMLAPLPPEDRAALLGSMHRVESLLSASRPPENGFALRKHRPGDLGWIVERHGALYAAEQGWDERFEGYVAEIVAAFAARHDERRERLWIAERGGQRVGSVLLVARSPGAAQLRLLLVEPGARGCGLGRRLVGACLEFARRAGYRKVVLWTEAGLGAAQRIYESAGFRRVSRKRERLYGRAFVGELWEIAL
jgi:DNA-binding MarR family transcriptional regulator/predicted N-acetyltransferase YhbS